MRDNGFVCMGICQKSDIKVGPTTSLKDFFDQNAYKEDKIMDELHYLLMRANTAMNRNIFRGAQKINLSSGQPKILEYLTERNGDNQKAIAVYCGVEPATLGSILLRMEKNGLIERKRKKEDGRSLYVYITPKGLKAADDMKAVYDKYDEKGTEGLSEEEIALLKRMLFKVFKNLNEG